MHPCPPARYATVTSGTLFSFLMMLLNSLRLMLAFAFRPYFRLKMRLAKLKKPQDYDVLDMLQKSIKGDFTT